MKILAGVLATCFAAMPLYAQDSGKPPEGAPPPPEAPATPGAADASKPADTTPEPAEAPEGTTPDKPAAPPQG